MKEKEKKISNKALEVIQSYESLKFRVDKKVRCPYYRNYRKKSGMKLRALSGKGTPEEIISETKIHAHINGFDWQNSDEEQIRSFMYKKDIGIDCSGFITWVIYFWLKNEYKINLYRYFRKKYRRNFKKWLRLLFRPSQNIGVVDLTSEQISFRIDKLREVQPGDYVRTRKGNHILLITKLIHHKGNLKMIEYYHSTDMYGKANGIRRGEIEINSSESGLSKQSWLESDENGKNWTYAGFLDNDSKNGIYRLKLLEDLKS